MPIGRTAESSVSSSRITRAISRQATVCGSRAVRSATRPPVEQAVAGQRAADAHQPEQVGRCSEYSRGGPAQTTRS